MKEDYRTRRMTTARSADTDFASGGFVNRKIGIAFVHGKIEGHTGADGGSQRRETFRDAATHTDQKKKENTEKKEKKTKKKRRNRPGKRKKRALFESEGEGYSDGRSSVACMATVDDQPEQEQAADPIRSIASIHADGCSHPPAPQRRPPSLNRSPTCPGRGKASPRSIFGRVLAFDVVLVRTCIVLHPRANLGMWPPPCP